jgi:DNA adenine methylase
VPFSRAVYEQWVREYFDGYRPDDDIERAGRWFFLRYSQYNGSLDRRNGFKTGGKRNEARSFRGSIHALELIADRFAEVSLECEPYDDVLARYDHPDTVFYLDPPYYQTSSDRAHYRVGGEFDHSQLVDELRDLEADWLVSYEALPPELADVAETVAEYTAMYSMQYADERQERTEHVVMSFDPIESRLFAPAQQTTLDDLSREGGDDRGE